MSKRYEPQYTLGWGGEDNKMEGKQLSDLSLAAQ